MLFFALCATIFTIFAVKFLITLAIVWVSLLVMEGDRTFWNIPSRALLWARLATAILGILFTRQVQLEIMYCAGHYSLWACICGLTRAAHLIQICWWCTNTQIFRVLQCLFYHGRGTKELPILRPRPALHWCLPTWLGLLQVDDLTQAAINRFHFNALRLHHFLRDQMCFWNFLHARWLFM